MQWDPQQYSRYSDERGRPFGELLSRIGAQAPSYVVDLGCGPGPLTRTLADRWPGASVTGVDSSPDMVEAAAEHRVPGRVEFVLGGAEDWQPDRPVDVLIANALFQWVPGHVSLFARYASWLAPGGWFGMQVPSNFDEPSHTLLRDLRVSARWRDQVGLDADRDAAVETPERYLDVLVAAGLEPDVWQTMYLHVLPGDDAVLEWVKGTALRPVLSRLTGADRDEFLSEYGAALRAAYPKQSFGTAFRFRRTFAVGRKPA